VVAAPPLPTPAPAPPKVEPPPPIPATVLGADDQPLTLAVAKYSYDAKLDLCYIDSPVIDAVPDAPPKNGAPVKPSSFSVRVVTEGHTPEQPDRYEATFLSLGLDATDLSRQKITFIIDNTVPLNIDDSARRDAGTVDFSAQDVRYALFYITPQQLSRVAGASNLGIFIDQRYDISPAGVATLRAYLADVAKLRTDTSPWGHAFHRWVSRFLPFLASLSEIGQTAVVSSFGIILLLLIVAFIFGVTRFVKM
jgi:hypothetical protein